MTFNITASGLDIIKTIAGCVALFTLIFAIKQIRIAKKSIALASFKSIYDDNFKIRKKFGKAIKQRDELVEILNSFDKDVHDMVVIYGSKKYDDLREIGYHYEYVAILVKEKLIPESLIFDLLVFPDGFWRSSGHFVKLMRANYYKDFWINFQSLKKIYDKRRLKFAY